MHRYNIKILIIMMYMVLSILDTACATENNKLTKKWAMSTLKTYVELQANAELWSKEGAEKIGNLTSFDPTDVGIHGDELAYIIYDYNINEANIRNDEGHVEVCYLVIGIIKDRVEFHEKIYEEYVKIYVDLVGGKWFIRTHTPPYIYWRAYINYLSSLSSGVSVSDSLGISDINKAVSKIEHKQSELCKR